MSWYASPGFFTLPQNFAPLYCQRDQYWAGQISAFMGDHSYASVLWCNFSSHPLENADSLRDCLRSSFGSLYLTFLSFTQIAMTDWKIDKGGEWDLTYQMTEVSLCWADFTSVYGFFLDGPWKIFILKSCSKLQSSTQQVKLTIVFHLTFLKKEGIPTN